jgi:hypothetical protein
MLRLGISHIADGTDHQLFLLTLLLPAPLLAVRRRWREVVPTGRAVRRISAITIAFTIGHSVTLALGTLGLPVPQQPVEALIAVRILIAAAHALRPLFPGREPLIAGVFGLVHGMAFSTTLSALDLSGKQLALSLLGFNLGIEVMQLVVVLVVLPPLIVLARTRAYRPLRSCAAGAHRRRGRRVAARPRRAAQPPRHCGGRPRPGLTMGPRRSVARRSLRGDPIKSNPGQFLGEHRPQGSASYASVPLADAHHPRHSCDMHRRTVERAARRADRARTRVKRECTHGGGHHGHGTRAAYVKDHAAAPGRPDRTGRRL